MSYKIKLDIFEGPLDLLLYLIKKEELDIYDIPIACITEQYLQYLEFMKLMDLDIAGDFLVMAATLMQIKSRMLLPPEELTPEEQEEQDPREELVRRLIEYKKFKEAASGLRELEQKRMNVFTRTSAPKEFTDASGEKYFEVSLFDLINAFSKALKDVPKELFQEIIRDEFTVEQKIHDFYHMLVSQPVIRLSELFKKANSKPEIIVIFLAVLELIRLKEVTIRQKELFGEIEIVRSAESIKPKTGQEVEEMNKDAL
jgi:segregation and condensation protein A